MIIALLLVVVLAVAELPPSQRATPEVQAPCKDQAPPTEKAEAPLVCGPTKPEKKPVVKRPKKKAPDAYRQPTVPR